MVICSVYDSKAEGFLPPFFMRNAAMAVRAFEAMCRDQGSDFARFPEDYALLELGWFSDVNASFIIHPTPRSLVTASAVCAMIKRGDPRPGGPGSPPPGAFGFDDDGSGPKARQ